MRDEWRLVVDDQKKVVAYEKGSMQQGYRLWGISMWTWQDGEKLMTDIAREYEAGNWSQYWDEVALGQCKQTYNLGIREIASDAIMEIDTLDELATIDASYKKYQL